MHAVFGLTSGILRSGLLPQIDRRTCQALQHSRHFSVSALANAFSFNVHLAIVRTTRQRSSLFENRPFTRTFASSLARRSEDIKKSTDAPTQTTADQTKPAAKHELTWRDYDPAGGLPLEEGDLPQMKIGEVFHGHMDLETGNWIIRLMNWRRHSGALIDQGIDFEASVGITREQAYAALQYLRSAHPDFDESQAGVTWAEAQIQTLSAEYVARAEKLGLIKRVDGEEEIDPESDASHSVYGDSQLIAMKRANEARVEAENRRRQEQLEREELAAQEAAVAAARSQSSSSSHSASEATSDSTAVSSSAAARATLARRDRAAWVKHYEARAQLSSSPVAPSMPLLSRLGPSLLLTILVLGGCYILHESYVAPPESARWYPDISASTATLGTLIGSMLLVAMAYRFPPLWRTFNKFFIVVPAAPRAASVVLAMFTHQQFSHWFWNSILLFAFGRYLHDDVDRGTLLAIFLATGTAANFATLATHVLRRNWSVYSYGSSAAVYGVLTAACLLRAENDVTIFGYTLPMTGVVLLGVFAALDVLAFVRGGAVASSVNFAGHAAGFIGGGLCAMGIRTEKRKEKERRLLADEQMVRKDA